MTINVVNPFKSQTASTFDKNKIDQDVHGGECLPSVGLSLHSGKKIFKFGTTVTVVDDNLSKPKSLEHAVSRTIPLNWLHLTRVLQKAVRSSFFNVCADIHVEKQRRILSKVKSVKSNITKLLKPTGRASAAVPCIDPLAIPSVEHSTTNGHSSSLSILQHPKPKARVVTAYKFTPPQHTILEAIASPVAYGGNVADEPIKDLSATFCGLVEASSPSPTGQLFTTPESQLDTFPSTFALSELQTIEEEDGSTEFVVRAVNSEQKEVAISGAYTSRSNSDSAVTVYLSSDTLSDHTTAHGVGLVSSEISTSPGDTSFATSVDADDSHQFLPGAHRGLRRVPSYEDLRVSCFKSSNLPNHTFADLVNHNLQTIANRDVSCSDMSCGSSDCDFSYGKASGIDTAPLRKLRKCDNLRKSFLLLEPKICTPSTRQMNKYRKFRTWLSARGHESSRNTQKTSTSRASRESLKATPVSRSRQFIQSVLYPSRRVQEHVFKLPPLQPSPPSSPPVWSCAKITRSSSKAKKRRRMTKQSMKRLKARLDSMDIEPWY
ncbi:hypothetical protein J3R82DRAFT_11528 [Butyriboletus roseoflavus]|nr:hypothetical protein J3R82DRAFT_11528 [Butyriboletus roseoflavus]